MLGLGRLTDWLDESHRTTDAGQGAGGSRHAGWGSPPPPACSRASAGLWLPGVSGNNERPQLAGFEGSPVARLETRIKESASYASQESSPKDRGRLVGHTIGWPSAEAW